MNSNMWWLSNTAEDIFVIRDGKELQNPNDNVPCGPVQHFINDGNLIVKVNSKIKLK